MKKLGIIKYLRIWIFSLLFLGAIGSSFGVENDGLGVGCVVENSLEGSGEVKAWEVLSDAGSGLKLDVPSLTKLSDDFVANPLLENLFKKTPSKIDDVWKSFDEFPNLRRNIDFINEGDYLLGKGFSKSDLKGFAAYVDNVFPNTKSNLSTRIGNTSGFNLIHTDSQLQAILLRAKSLDLSSGEIDDLLFTSCRTTKQIASKELIQQMDNWVNVVKKRGYPYLFPKFSDFVQFGNILKNKAAEWGLPVNKFNVQGSTLRNSNVSQIGDIDIAYKVGVNDFDNLVQQFKDATTNSSTRNAIDADAGKGIIRGYNMYLNPQTSGSFTGQFYTAFKNSFGMEFKDFFGVNKIQISVIKEGWNLDVSPYLKID